MTKRKTKRQRYVLIPLLFFLHKYQHKVQSPRAKELSRKGIKDGNMDAIFCKQYAWIDSMIEVPNKIIINDIFTPFTVSLNTHLTDILIKETLTDSPLFIIKENSNCGNFLNNGIFTLLTDIINYNPLTDFPINKRLYKEILFHIPSQNEIYSKIYMDRIILDFKNRLKPTHFDRLHHDCSNTTVTQQEHKSVQRDVCFIIYTLYYKNDFLIKHFKKTLQTNIDRKVFKINSTKALQKDIYFQNHISRHNLFSKTQLQTNMSKRTSQADKGKGKAPAVQPHFQKPSIRISDLHEGVSIETISLQDTLSTEAMYSCGEKSVILQKMLHTDLMF